MAVIAFFTKRDLPSALCASALVAIGFAASGQRVARGIHDPEHRANGRIMRQSLPGVDAISSDWRSGRAARASALGMRDGDHVIIDFDIELWPDAVRDFPFDLAVLADCGTWRFPSPGPSRRTVYLPCSRVGFERPHLVAAPPFPVVGTWVPVLTPADVSSLSSGAPLPRPRTAAGALVRALRATLPDGFGTAAAAVPQRILRHAGRIAAGGIRIPSEKPIESQPVNPSL